MLELTAEDKYHVCALAKVVLSVMQDLTCPSDEVQAAMSSLIWNELRAAHSANKQARIQEEMQAKMRELGSSANAAAPGYYGQKL